MKNGKLLRNFLKVYYFISLFGQASYIFFSFLIKSSKLSSEQRKNNGSNKQKAHLIAGAITLEDSRFSNRVNGTGFQKKDHKMEW